jgi:hypothetical protein
MKPVTELQYFRDKTLNFAKISDNGTSVVLAFADGSYAEFVSSGDVTLSQSPTIIGVYRKEFRWTTGGDQDA